MLLVEDIPFSVVPVALPYRLPKEECYFGSSPYNMELALSELDMVLPFGVVCGGGAGELTLETYATIELSPDVCILTWHTVREVLRYSFKDGARALAYKLVMEDPDKTWDGGLVCQPITIREASEMDICQGKEQIVVFMPDGVLIRRGRAKSFSWVKPPTD